MGKRHEDNSQKEKLKWPLNMFSISLVIREMQIRTI